MFYMGYIYVIEYLDESGDNLSTAGDIFYPRVWDNLSPEKIK